MDECSQSAKWSQTMWKLFVCDDFELSDRWEKERRERKKKEREGGRSL